ncbi:MAG: glucoamylase family protein [Bradyrhizobium sp.]
MDQALMSEAALDKLQRDTFGYFLKEANRANGMVPDNTRKGAHASITAIGFALTAYTIGVERGFIARTEAIQRTLTTLRFFRQSEQSEAPSATGYKGFYYHFLYMDSGRRAWESELSTIDSTFLLVGALTAAAYFDGDTPEEREIRTVAEELYARADWEWALNAGETVSMGWKPECGFLPYRWEGYNEGLILYVLALASPTHPIPSESYKAQTRTYRWKTLFGYEFLYAGPLFVHQLSHMWVDFRGIQDEFMREKRIDYFENSRRATYVQQQYAIQNPLEYEGYSEHCWGLTASDGPGPTTLRIDGVERRFFDYEARGVPYGPDDGTIAPWAAAASLPFAPEIVLPALQHFSDRYPEMISEYGFKCSFNPTFIAAPLGKIGWISKGYYGLDQGPIVIMIENHRSGFFWELMKKCPFIAEGLLKAGFRAVNPARTVIANALRVGDHLLEPLG